jgi:REP element-mobilizing transposase RayT
MDIIISPSLPKTGNIFFGKIVEQEMYLSPIGNFVKENILKFIIDDAAENPYLHNPYFLFANPTIIGITKWAILPDHIHLIIEIINREQKEYNTIAGLSPLSKGSLSAFTNHFKGYVTRWCKQNGFPEFGWQSRFHDRVVRNNAEYDKIAWYIDNNVLNWKDDEIM